MGKNNSKPKTPTPIYSPEIYRDKILEFLKKSVNYPPGIPSLIFEFLGQPSGTIMAKFPINPESKEKMPETIMVHITTDSEGYIYIADQLNNYIKVFLTNGTFVRKWGRYGSGDSEFSEIRGISIGLNGLLYVVDSGNRQIKIFKKDGTFVKKRNCSYRPHGITCQNHLIYVIYYNSYEIDIRSSDGDIIKIVSICPESEYFFRPALICCNNGEVYVMIESFSTDILIYSMSGNIIKKIPRQQAISRCGIYPAFSLTCNPYGIIYYTTEEGICKINEIGEITLIFEKINSLCLNKTNVFNSEYRSLSGVKYGQDGFLYFFNPSEQCIMVMSV